MKQFFIQLDRMLVRLYFFSGFAAALCLIGIALLVLANIISRMLSVYVPGLTEYSGYTMAAGSFLALAYTFENRGHIRVELLLSRLSVTRRWLAEIWCLSIGVVVSILLAAYFTKLVYWSWKFQEHSEGSDAVLLWKPQAFVMIGSIIFATCIIHHWVKCIVKGDEYLA